MELCTLLPYSEILSGGNGDHKQMREGFERWDQLDNDSQGPQSSSQKEAETLCLPRPCGRKWEPRERHKGEQSQGRMKMSELS